MLNSAEEDIDDESEVHMAEHRNGIVTCRICHEWNGTLIEPCFCKGTVAKVHRICLEKWLNSNGTKKCELCSFEYNVNSVLRYSLMESIVIWIRRQSRRQQILFHDFLLFGTIMIISTLMIGILLYTIQHIYFHESLKDQLPPSYFVGLCVVTVLWTVIFLTSVAMCYNHQIKPWFQWWQRTRRVSLLN